MAEQEKNKAAKEFEEHSQGKRTGLMVEFFEFLMHNKKWWLLPIVLVLLALGALIFLGSGLGPFIYPLL